MKDIKGFEGKYKITENGEIWSYNLYAHKEPRQMKTYLDSKNKYVYIKLSKEGIVKAYSIHRLVAETFIPNPDNLSEVDHIDNNPQNNNVDNLRWVNRIDNINKRFKQSRDQYCNCNETKLYKDNHLIKTFRSEKEACQYAKDNYGVKFYSLQKYKKWNNFHIEN